MRVYNKEELQSYKDPLLRSAVAAAGVLGLGILPKTKEFPMVEEFIKSLNRGLTQADFNEPKWQNPFVKNYATVFLLFYIPESTHEKEDTDLKKVRTLKEYTKKAFYANPYAQAFLNALMEHPNFLNSTIDEDLYYFLSEYLLLSVEDIAFLVRVNPFLYTYTAQTIKKRLGSSKNRLLDPTEIPNIEKNVKDRIKKFKDPMYKLFALSIYTLVNNEIFGEFIETEKIEEIRDLLDKIISAWRKRSNLKEKAQKVKNMQELKRLFRDLLNLLGFNVKDNNMPYFINIMCTFFEELIPNKD